MKIPIVIFWAFFLNSSKAQTVDWKTTHKWKLYVSEGHNLFKYSVDSLTKFKHTDLKDDSVRFFLNSVSVMTHDRTPVWMGAYLASCENDGKILKIEISQYGGFFYCEMNQTYYLVSSEAQKEWLNYLNDCYGNAHL